MFEIDWKLFVEVWQVIASTAVAIALGFTVKTFFWARKADQLKLTEGVFKDLREMQRELHRQEEGFSFDDWYSRFFNTLEWFSLLVNVNDIKDKKIKGFFKDAIIQWYDELFSDDDKENKKKYPEFKKLYSKYKNVKFKGEE